MNPNMNYLGVYPLNLCLEQGDIDMAAVLLTAGADADQIGSAKQAR